MSLRAHDMAEYGVSILLIPISSDSKWHPHGRGPTIWQWVVVSTQGLDEEIVGCDLDIESPIEAVKKAVEAFNEYVNRQPDDWEGFL